MRTKSAYPSLSLWHSQSAPESMSFFFVYLSPFTMPLAYLGKLWRGRQRLHRLRAAAPAARSPKTGGLEHPGASTAAAAARGESAPLVGAGRGLLIPLRPWKESPEGCRRERIVNGELLKLEMLLRCCWQAEALVAALVPAMSSLVGEFPQRATAAPVTVGPLEDPSGAAPG